MVRTHKDQIKFILRKIILLALAVVVAFPIFYMFSSSLFSARDFNKVRLLPAKAVFANYVRVLSHRYFATYIFNSVGTSVLAAMIRTLVTIFAAFALTHLHFRGRKLIMGALVLTLFVPQEAILYQNYRTVAALGLLDTWTGIICTSLFSAAQLVLVMGSFLAQDRSYYDASRIDGASDMRYVFSVLVPLSGPAIMTVAIQTLITTFNSYLWPLLVTNRMATRTVQTGVTMMGFAESGETGAQMAALVLMTAPFMLVLAFTKKRIEKALIRR